MKYVRLYTDHDGRSRFQDLDFTLVSTIFAPPAPPLDVSEPVAASAFMVLRMPAGWTDAAHPAPARQFMLMLAGSVEVLAGGETRLLSTGDVNSWRTPPGQGTGPPSSTTRSWLSYAYNWTPEPLAATMVLTWARTPEPLAHAPRKRISER